jgi:hypothetical protein
VSALIVTSDSNSIYADFLRPFGSHGEQPSDVEANFSQRVKRICTATSGRRILVSYDNCNFYVYDSKKSKLDGIYIAQHAEKIKAIQWTSATGKSLITISDKIVLAKTKIADAGAWSSKNIDISQDYLSQTVINGKNKHTQQFALNMKNKDKKGEAIGLNCVCMNPFRQDQTFCGDNTGSVHVVDINKGKKLNSYEVSEVGIASLVSNGFYVVIVFEDGSCSVFDSSFEYLAIIEKPFTGQSLNFCKENAACLKARLLEGKF